MAKNVRGFAVFRSFRVDFKNWTRRTQAQTERLLPPEMFRVARRHRSASPADSFAQQSETGSGTVGRLSSALVAAVRGASLHQSSPHK